MGAGGLTGSLDWDDRAILAFKQFLRKYQRFLDGVFCAVVWLILLILAVEPFWSGAEFHFIDVLRSRIYLSVSMMPLVLLVATIFPAGFRLEEFRVNHPEPGPQIARRARALFKNRTFLMVLFAGLVFWLDPIGVYASSHTKALVRVFYATDRKTMPAGEPGWVTFSNEPDLQQPLSYGKAVVPVAWRPGDVWRHLWSPIPLASRHDAVQLASLVANDFSLELETAASASHHEALLFVHGFHNPFTDALDTTARLSYDLKFDGPTILFSWASGNWAGLYDHDYENATLGIPHFETVLLQVNGITGIDTVHVIAHSMGVRVTAEAIYDLETHGTPKRIKNLILAAGDIPENLFTRDSEALRTYAQRTTLYVSAWDLALRLSGGLHVNNRVGSRAVARDGMDVIDTQGLDTSLTGFYHGYLFDSQLVLTDLAQLINAGTPPTQRVGIRKDNSQCCWTFEHR